MNSQRDKAEAADFISAIRRLSPQARALIFKSAAPVASRLGKAPREGTVEKVPGSRRRAGEKITGAVRAIEAAFQPPCAWLRQAYRAGDALSF